MSELANLYNALRNRTNLNAQAEAERKRVREQQRMRQEQKDAKRHAERMGQLQLLGQIGGAALGAAYLPGAGLATNAASGALMGSSFGSAGAGLAAAFTPNILGTQPDADNPYYAPVSQTQATSQAIGAGLSAWSSYEQAKALKAQQLVAAKMRRQLNLKVRDPNNPMSAEQVLAYVAPIEEIPARQSGPNFGGYASQYVREGRPAQQSQLLQDLGIKTEADLNGLTIDDANLMAMGLANETVETILPIADVYRNHNASVVLRGLAAQSATELRADLDEYLTLSKSGDVTPEWLSKQSEFIQHVHKTPKAYQAPMMQTIIELSNATDEERREREAAIRENVQKDVNDRNMDLTKSFYDLYERINLGDPDVQLLDSPVVNALIDTDSATKDERGVYQEGFKMRPLSLETFINYAEARRPGQHELNFLAATGVFKNAEREAAAIYMQREEYGVSQADVDRWLNKDFRILNPIQDSVDAAKRKTGYKALSNYEGVAKEAEGDSSQQDSEAALASTDFIEDQPTLSTKPTVEQPALSESEALSEAEANVEKAAATADQNPDALLEAQQELVKARMGEQGANLEKTVGEGLTAARNKIDELTAMTRSEYATYLKNVDNDQLYNEHKKVEDGQREHVEKYNNDAGLRRNAERSEFWVTQGTILRTRLEQVEQEMRSRDLEPPVSNTPPPVPNVEEVVPNRSDNQTRGAVPPSIRPVADLDLVKPTDAPPAPALNLLYTQARPDAPTVLPNVDNASALAAIRRQNEQARQNRATAEMPSATVERRKMPLNRDPYNIPKNYNPGRKYDLKLAARRELNRLRNESLKPPVPRIPEVKPEVTEDPNLIPKDWNPTQSILNWAARYEPSKVPVEKPEAAPAAEMNQVSLIANAAATSIPDERFNILDTSVGSYDQNYRVVHPSVSITDKLTESHQQQIEKKLSEVDKTTGLTFAEQYVEETFEMMIENDINTLADNFAQAPEYNRDFIAVLIAQIAGKYQQVESYIKEDQPLDDNTTETLAEAQVILAMFYTAESLANSERNQ